MEPETQEGMELILTETEARVLGALIEKDITTPEYYPLSLNALANACNQKSNRDPVMQLDENTVRDALSGLQEQRLAGPTGGADSRVPKYEHRAQEVFNFTRAETAVLCVLLLRGPQTPGELRGRTERLHHFETLDDVQSALQKLMQRQPRLVKMLPRQPGTKESRYSHLLSGDANVIETPQLGAGAIHQGDRIARLEEEVNGLRMDVAELKRQLEGFRTQFE
ncbi:MAG: YceH family protein [Terriglobales bacterium]